MSSLGLMLVFFGILVIAAPLGWVGLNKLQDVSEEREKRQKSRRSKS